MQKSVRVHGLELYVPGRSQRILLPVVVMCRYTVIDIEVVFLCVSIKHLCDLRRVSSV